MGNMWDNTDIQDMITAVKEDDSALLSEALNRVEAMLAYEDVGWSRLSEAVRSGEGLTLNQLKQISARIREDIVGSPLIKRGVALRGSYVFSKGINIPGFEFAPTAGSERRGRKPLAERFFRHPVNARYLFSASAHDELERTAAADGMIFFVTSHEGRVPVFRQVPLTEITNVASNPDHPAEEIAYLREWDVRFMRDGREVTEHKKRWYFVDTYTGPRSASLFGDDAEVDTENPMFVQKFNSQVGWAWGVPDAVSAVAWARLYTELVNYGRAMTKTMAKYALAFKSQKKSTAQDMVGARLSGAGGIAGIGTGNDLMALATAGKTYNFDGLRPVAAMVATALEVSVVHLLSDPGAAGSSYGSAQNLDMPTKRAIVNRQDLWASFFERVVEFATGDRVQVSFPALDDPDPYREMQVVALGWNTGLVHKDEARARVLRVGQFEDLFGAAPEETSVPGGDESVSVASPDQGRSNNVGDVDSTLSNDIPE